MVLLTLLIFRSMEIDSSMYFRWEVYADQARSETDSSRKTQFRVNPTLPRKYYHSRPGRKLLLQNNNNNFPIEKMIKSKYSAKLETIMIEMRRSEDFEFL